MRGSVDAHFLGQFDDFVDFGFDLFAIHICFEFVNVEPNFFCNFESCGFVGAAAML